MNCLVTETRYAATCPVTLDQASEHTEQTWQLKHQKEKDALLAELHWSLRLREKTGDYTDSTQTFPSPQNSQQLDAHSLSNHVPRTLSPSVIEGTCGIM